eukprot:1438050-Karenia_brevis.AAC.1
MEDDSIISIEEFNSFCTKVSSLVFQGLIHVPEDTSHNKQKQVRREWASLPDASQLGLFRAFGVVQLNVKIGRFIQLFDFGDNVWVDPESMQCFNKLDVMHA